MGCFINAPMEKIRAGATYEERERMFFAHCEKMQKANPHLMLPYGVKKRWWHFMKQEHPFTKLHPKADISTVKRGEWLTDGEEDYVAYADAVVINGVPTVETTDSGDCVKFFKQGDKVWKTVPERILKVRAMKREISTELKAKQEVTSTAS